MEDEAQQFGSAVQAVTGGQWGMCASPEATPAADVAPARVLDLNAVPEDAPCSTLVSSQQTALTFVPAHLAATSRGLQDPDVRSGSISTADARTLRLEWAAAASGATAPSSAPDHLTAADRDKPCTQMEPRAMGGGPAATDDNLDRQHSNEPVPRPGGAAPPASAAPQPVDSLLLRLQQRSAGIRQPSLGVEEASFPRHLSAGTRLSQTNFPPAAGAGDKPKVPFSAKLGYSGTASRSVGEHVTTSVVHMLRVAAFAGAGMAVSCAVSNDCPTTVVSLVTRLVPLCSAQPTAHRLVMPNPFDPSQSFTASAVLNALSVLGAGGYAPAAAATQAAQSPNPWAAPPPLVSRRFPNATANAGFGPLKFVIAWHPSQRHCL